MDQWKVTITDHGFANIDPEQETLSAAGCDLQVAQCRSPEEIVRAVADSDGLLVQWAPITPEVIESLTRCKIIVRYGIGVDNIDLPAARSKGIPVCNVPDYGINEVADHAMSMALALARQLPQIDRRTRNGVWKLTPDQPIAAFEEATFATVGFGRIAQALLERARAFRFRLAACDPFASESAFENSAVTRVTLDEVFRSADIISLHVPLTKQTAHLINAERLGRMKSNAILINTARGGLIDTVALAEALRSERIAAAGLDVYEVEPLPDGHPLRGCPNALLTSHVAWFSESSMPRLQRLAAEEILRGLRGEPLRHPVGLA